MTILSFGGARTGRTGADTAHRLGRHGEQLPIRVIEIPDPRDGGHLLVFGEPRDGCLVRVHSRCLYGEGLGSDDCDCGGELTESMDRIQAEGAGVLVYLDQEGRGAGLIWKARGYRESEQSGTDTFDSYRSLGLDPDARCYEPAARAVRQLELTRVRLLTNNPDKCRALTEAGITVEPVALTIALQSARGRQYLQAKRRHRRHTIPADPLADEPQSARARSWWRPRGRG
ncbi:GTP cyclohydrolase II [Nocardia fluminea]|uniref:GTP cyclohydrolase II n=1 Tax=Nocardia fluminea TaxID=134984 RepID=A0A2N3VL83_9NOCA|nr:GTP cyclohydrolase II [Nocardia fluminea]PKV82380.1 3,4-dihydroxy 2-butanone 4-phosphate synthase/GTP cyclohydrolase II [Nocardia fluminea]